MFFFFLEIFIQNMQFIYTGICLNNLRYELHKLHFPNFRDYSGLQWQGPKLLSVKNSNFNFVSGSLP